MEGRIYRVVEAFLVVVVVGVFEFVTAVQGRRLGSRSQGLRPLPPKNNDGPYALPHTAM